MVSQFLYSNEKPNINLRISNKKQNIKLFSVAAVKGVALPYYSGDNLSSFKIPIFDTTPFKDAPSADESVAINNNRRRYYYFQPTASAVQNPIDQVLSTRPRIRPVYYPLPSVAGAHKHGQTVVIFFHGEEEDNKDTSLTISQMQNTNKIYSR
jgi:hypothetical protein